MNHHQSVRTANKKFRVRTAVLGVLTEHRITQPRTRSYLMRSSLLRRVGLTVAGTSVMLASVIVLVVPTAQGGPPPPC